MVEQRSPKPLTWVRFLVPPHFKIHIQMTNRIKKIITSLLVLFGIGGVTIYINFDNLGIFTFFQKGGTNIINQRPIPKISHITTFKLNEFVNELYFHKFRVEIINTPDIKKDSVDFSVNDVEVLNIIKNRTDHGTKIEGNFNGPYVAFSISFQTSKEISSGDVSFFLK